MQRVFWPAIASASRVNTLFNLLAISKTRNPTSSRSRAHQRCTMQGGTLPHRRDCRRRRRRFQWVAKSRHLSEQNAQITVRQRDRFTFVPRETKGSYLCNPVSSLAQRKWAQETSRRLKCFTLFRFSCADGWKTQVRSKYTSAAGDCERCCKVG